MDTKGSEQSIMKWGYTCGKVAGLWQARKIVAEIIDNDTAPILAELSRMIDMGEIEIESLIKNENVKDFIQTNK